MIRGPGSFLWLSSLPPKRRRTSSRATNWVRTAISSNPWTSISSSRRSTAWACIGCSSINLLLLHHKFRGSLSCPEVQIIGYKTGCVHLEIPNEATAGRLIAIRICRNSAVNLIKGFEGEAGEAQPGRFHFGGFSNGKVQPADREQVCRWAEVQVNVDAPGHFGPFLAVDPPAASSVNRDFQLDDLISNPAGDRGRRSLPRWITPHPVIQP